MIFEKVKEILAEQLDLDPNDITLESLIQDDLGADSLDVVDMLMSIEDEFSVEIPDEVVETVKSVKDLVDYIENNQ